MQDMGWEQGKCLGKSENGMTDCVQIKRRERVLAAGNMSPGATLKWGLSGTMPTTLPPRISLPSH
jgi:hypothetical protein